MVSVNTDKLLDGLKSYFSFGEIAEDIERVKANFWLALYHGDVFDLLYKVIVQVEELAQDVVDIEGSDKKEAVVKWLDECIELPKLLDAKPFDLDGRLLAPMIDVIVEYINDHAGKDWFIEEDEDEENDSSVVGGVVNVNSDNGNGQ